MSRLPAPNVRESISPAPRAARAIFLINDLRMGGAERSLVNFVNALHHVRPTVVLIEPAADLLGELSPGVTLVSLHTPDSTAVSATELRAVIRAAPPRRRGRARGQMILELPGLVRKSLRLAQLARATKTPVISTFLNRSHTIALVAKLLFAPQLRVVINVHEMLSDHLDLHFSPVERRLMRAFIVHGFTRATRIIAVSEGVREDLVRRFSIPPDRITVIHNPLDLAGIKRASMEVVDDAVMSLGGALIVGVGRLVRLKGFDLLIRACAQLPKTLRAKLLLIGEGEERPTLERLIVELEVADRVTLLGSQINPWKYMARADVLVLPSRTEAFPNVIGEALALSVPVIAARCSDGVAEYLEGGRCGVLVPPDDVAALADALERVLGDEELRRLLAHRGAERAEALDLPHVMERYERLIAEAAEL